MIGLISERWMMNIAMGKCDHCVHCGRPMTEGELLSVVEY
jgi:hypothetical protein